MALSQTCNRCPPAEAGGYGKCRRSAAFGMSTPFRLVLRIRERMYAAGVLKIHRLKHAVISIGNLTLGGTGKTPLTILIAEKMKQKGYAPVVLSRGYGRKTRGVRIVSRGKGPLISWQDAG